MTAVLSRDLSPADVARWAIALGGAGVTWPTIRRLAEAVRLAGVPAVLDLGSAIVDGPAQGRDAVRSLLRRLATVAHADGDLERVGQVLRLISGLAEERR